MPLPPEPSADVRAKTAGRSDRIWALLLAIQTAAALVIVLHIQAAFQRLLDTLGRQQVIEPRFYAELAAAALVIQLCYWYRLLRRPSSLSWRSVLIGHVLVFTSKLSFIFGGALFSVVFFRHLPEFETLPDAFGLALRGGLLITMLFSLFCYTLELERFGNALQAPRGQRACTAAAPRN